MPIEPQPCGAGGDAGDAVDVEQTLLCDVLPNGDIVGSALAVYEYDSSGNPTGAPTFVDPVTGLPYVPQGVLQPCGDTISHAVEILCDVNDADGSAVQFERIKTIGPAGTVLSVSDFGLDGAPYTPLNTVQVCDPTSTCTPESNQDLNAECGPGEPVIQEVLLADLSNPLANSVFNDDDTADPLCGGTWDRPADDLPAGFPVAESFRNTTFDQPGPVVTGQPADLPFLTAGAPTNDGAGAGWLRLADGRGGSNGIWQVPGPFSTSQGMNAAVTLASHDGTTPGGDGQYFVFTDGAAGTQATPIGGFGNLGLNNWTGGVFAIVLDEYGQSCTCGQALPSDPNPGPCGFCSNTISIQRAGASRVGASCACCTIASAPLAPKAINLTTRSQPLRLLTSVISEGGQTYVSASIDWNDGNGPIQYFDRVNITACITVPPTLRMGLSMNSGGAYQAIKEARDAVARPAGVSNWRAFPITTDAIPACVTLVNISASVDVTPNDDGTQTAGNGDPELYFWLVNNATNTVLDRDQYSIIPSQLGQVQTLTVAASVPPADVPNLRLYVGAESRDDNGEYDTTWENLTVDATGAGCPATPRRTMEISARCPIPVTIVGGGTGDGGGGGTTIVNTPSTFEDVAICATVGGVPQTAFRRELRTPDGGVEVTFLGLNGLPITPDGGWTPGPCPGTCDSLVLGNVCVTSPDFPGTTLPAVAVQSCEDGTVAYVNAATGEPWPNASGPVICPPENQTWEEILCDQGNDNQPFRRIYNLTPLGSVVFYDETLDAADYVVVGPAVTCASGGLVLGERCYNIPEDGPLFSGGLGSAGSSNFTFVPFHLEYQDYLGSGVDITIDSTIAGNPIDASHIQFNPAGSHPVSITFSEPVALNSITVGELDGQNQEFVEQFNHPVTGLTGNLFFFGVPFPDTVHTTAINGNPDGDIQFGGVQTTSLTYQVRSNGLGQWLQGISFNTLVAGDVGRAAVVRCQGCDEGSGLAYIDLATGAVLDPDTTAWVECTQTVTVANPTEFADTEVLQLCDSTGSVPFLRRLTFDATGALTSTVDTDYDGAPYAVVGDAVDCAAGATGRDEELLVLCDSTPTRFLRRYNYDAATGNLIGIVNTTLDGSTPFAPVGAVAVCTTAIASDFDFVVQPLCDSAGTPFFRRLTFNSGTGAVTSTTDTTLAGAAFVPVGAVGLCSNCCPSVVGNGCTNTGSGFYTAIRATNGTISLIDSVTGAAVAPANIVPCPSDNTVRTLTAQARQLTNATPWTPGADVAGTLTSLTVTGLSGLWDLVDANGTVLTGLPAGLTLTWQADDDNTLTGPTSVTPQAGASVVAHWTQK